MISLNQNIFVLGRIYLPLREIKLEEFYIYGENNFIDDFYVPCLSTAKRYDRAAGFFHSSIYQKIKMGLEPFIKNGGKIRLITSVQLSQKDIDLINTGYEERKWLEENMTSVFQEFNEHRDQPDVANLCWLIKHGLLDIKITMPYVSTYTKPNAIYHDKIGVFYDSEEDDNDYVVFFGSNNESSGGWVENIESFEVFCSWDTSVAKRALRRKRYFERLWKGTQAGVKTYDFPDALRQKLISIAPDSFFFESMEIIGDNAQSILSFKPRGCQIQAYQKLIESNNVCLFEMATGTGKTKAALYSCAELNNNWDMLLIFVPLIDLVKQWKDDIKIFFPDAYLILCGSEWPSWKSNFIDLIQARVPIRTIVISTYDSGKTDFFLSNIQLINNSRLALICDEVHNLGAGETINIAKQIEPEVRIGLSATPAREFDVEGTKIIEDYFNNNIFEFGIRAAIQEKYLIEYEYYVTPVFLTDSEWENYINLTKEINKLLHCEDEGRSGGFSSSKLDWLTRERASIIKTASNKLDAFKEIVKVVKPQQRTLVYGDSIDHLQQFSTALSQLSKEHFIYVGRVNPAVRPEMIDDFCLGIRKYLLAVKCLDEGIDIPICDTAIFISSTSSKREFVQRRGRVLRTGPGKNRAYIHDFIVVAPYDYREESEKQIAKNIITKEYGRISIIASDAINGRWTMNKLDDFLQTQGLDPYSM